LAGDERLLAAGHPVTVWNRSRAKTDLAAARGAKTADHPAGVAHAADIIFVCVTDDRSVAEVVFGENGIVHAATKDKILVDCSTIKPMPAGLSRAACGTRPVWRGSTRR
jgi:3-hydroxyisobutyrate dehydrogenase